MERGGDTMRRVSPAVCKSCTLSFSLSLSRATYYHGVFHTTPVSQVSAGRKIRGWPIRSHPDRYFPIFIVHETRHMSRGAWSSLLLGPVSLVRQGPPLKVLGTGGSIDSPIRNERGGRVEREELQPPRTRIQRIACAVDASNSIHLYPPPLIDRLSSLPHARADYNTFPTSRDPRRLS